MENGNTEGVLLSVRDLFVEYTSNRQVIHAVNGVSFDIARGETLGLVGETGAGKTTIAKSILRILPDRSAKIKSGEIDFEGQELVTLDFGEMQKIRGDKISMVFQDPMTALNPVKNIGSQVSGVIALHNNISKDEAWERAREMLGMVGIMEDRMKEFPHQFSGGMKQRVVIAMALACNPDLLLADEPTTALDVTIQAQVLDMMNELKKKFETALVMITHDLGVVAKMCDDVAVMYAGRIVESGTLEDVFNRTMHPYTEGLFNSLPNISDRKSELKPIPGLMPDPTKLPPGCTFAPRCQYARDACANRKPELRSVSDTHCVACDAYDEPGFETKIMREVRDNG